MKRKLHVAVVLFLDFESAGMVCIVCSVNSAAIEQSIGRIPGFPFKVLLNFFKGNMHLLYFAKFPVNGQEI